MKTKPKRFFKILLAAILAILVILLAYVAYVFIAYYRVEDNLDLEVDQKSREAVNVEETLSVLSYNIGFGAYSDDYSFFMDGGKESRARSPEVVYDNVGGALKIIREKNPDFAFIQEVDLDGTRSHHIDQTALVREAFPEYSSVFAQNYDSPYLFWPLNEPHGANQAGTMTLSSCKIDSSLRRSLPIEEDFMKLVDLDRCYAINRIPTNDGRELILINFHLSAYTSDGKIAEDQLEMLFSDMQKELDQGNYVIAGGDFNKDILGNSDEIFGIPFGDATWAQPIPPELIPKDFEIVAPLDKEHPVASCRNADRPYGPDDFTLTVDGFIISNNVEVVSSEVIDAGFKYSDHNPVRMEFKLK